MYHLDIYSEHPQYKKVLSAPNSDLLYVPYYKHYAEWIGIILSIVALLYSFGIIIAAIVKKIRKQRQRKQLVVQHSLNIMLFFNIMWISYKTLSMTSYTSIKPFLIVNILYVLISICLSGSLLIKIKTKKVNYSRSG